MKSLIVPFLSYVSYQSPVSDQLAALDRLPTHDLKAVSWPDFPYRPTVRFKIAYTADSLLVWYWVKERDVQAQYRQTNDPVYKDSCVEFFLSFDGMHYYNFEFNCLAVGLIGYGAANKDKRFRLPVETVEKVRAFPQVGMEEGKAANVPWQLLLNIPFSVFESDRVDSLTGKRCTANFYKCGDDLPRPHFLSWNRIEHPTPNFHLPQFFGELVFQ